ncbi:GNAT family N-acetyltransferase [archaeon]|nr:GNAT family N-acetyltransferase [archaeon]
MNIREFKTADLEAILHKMDGRHSKRREDKFKLVTASEAFYCYVAEEDSGIVGFVIMEELGDGISHYMQQVNVARKRCGIGRQLVQKVFEHVGSGRHISLCVNTDNTEAINFYEALGFKRSGFTEGYRKGQDKYWYRIEL